MSRYIQIWLLLIYAIFSVHSANGQSFYSAWTEQGASNRLSHVIIEFKNRKVTIQIPKEDRTPLIFEGEMETDLNTNPQTLKAYVKEMDNPPVSSEYLDVLEVHKPRLVCHISEDDDDIIKFEANRVEFWVPEKHPGEYLRANDYPYLKKNIFIVDSSWVKTSRAFNMRSLLESDSYYGTGLVCGLIDGLMDDIKMVMSIAEFVNQNSLIFFGDMQLFDQYVGPLDRSFVEEYGFLLPSQFHPEAVEARAMHKKIAETIGKYIADEEKLYEFGVLMKDQLAELLSEWFVEVSGNNTPAIAGYQHGKVLYSIITMFIGVKEVSLLLQAGDKGLDILKLVKNMACFTGETFVKTNHGNIRIENLNIGINFKSSE